MNRKTGIRGFVLLACFALLAHGCSHAGKSSAVSEQLDCARAVASRLKQVGERYARLADLVTEQSMPADLRSQISGCPYPDDGARLAILVHEGTHMLSGSGKTLLKLLKRGVLLEEVKHLSLDDSFEETSYPYYRDTVDGGPLRVPYFKGTPRMDEIFSELRNSVFLTRAKTYFGERSPARNLYVLLDEWNAYIASVLARIKLLEKDQCRWTVEPDGSRTRNSSDEGNSLLEFRYYFTVYFAHLERTHPALGSRIVSDRQFRELILDLDRRTQKALESTDSLDCLFDQASKKGMLDRWGASKARYRKILSAFKGS